MADIDQTSKLTTWAKEPSVIDLKRDLQYASTSQNKQITKIDSWNDLFNVENQAKPPKIKGRSSVQPKLIRRQAEWRYPALTEPFLTSNKLFQVNPVTFEDTSAAKQNELVLNWQFRTKLNRVKFIDDFVRSTVDEGTSIVQVGWLRQTTEHKELQPIWDHYPVEDPQAIEQLTQAVEFKKANPRIYDESTNEAIKAAVDFYESSGIPTIAQQVGMEEVTVQDVLENKPTVTVLDPRNVFIDPTCLGDMDNALFVIVAFETNKAELLKNTDRYKNLDKVNWETATTAATVTYGKSEQLDFTFSDAIRKKVIAYEYWGFNDINDDGNLVPIVATWIDDVMIRMEENPFPDGKLPFVVTAYTPVKREVYGDSDANLLEDNQKILGAVTRGVIDLLGRSANSQIGIAKSLLDPLNRRRFENGQDYEFNPQLNPQSNIIEHKYPDIPQSALALISMQNNEAEALTGVKAFSGGLSSQAYGNVATGIRGMLDASAKREMSILRRLAKSVARIGEKIIAMNAVFLSEEETIRITNKEFITIQREDLKGNFDLEVDITTAEINDAKVQDLAFILQTIGPNIDPQITMMILSEIAGLKNMPELQERISTYQPQPDPLAEEMKQLEIEKIKSEIAYNNARAENMVASARAQDLDSEMEASGYKHSQAMEKQKAQAQGNQDLQVTKALTQSRKQGEMPADIDAAIGYNLISKQQSQEI